MKRRNEKTVQSILKVYIKLIAHIMGLVAVISSALGACHLLNYILHWGAK